MKKVRVVAYIPKELNEALDRRAYLLHESKSNVIQRALNDALYGEMLCGKLEGKIRKKRNLLNFLLKLFK